MSQQLYFIALIPPPEIEAEVNQFKIIASELFGSSHALKSPAHITLVPPFWRQSFLMEDMIQVILDEMIEIDRYEIELSGFACFKPRVIYVDVKPSPDLARHHKLLKDLFRTRWNLQPERRPHFRPHMTIAFKDLSKSNFFKAWDFFRSKEYYRKFTVDSVNLMLHREGRWLLESKISLDPG